MLTVPAMCLAPLHFEAMRTCQVAVAAARTAGATVMNPEPDMAQRAEAFDHVLGRRLRLMAERVGYGGYLTLWTSRPRYRHHLGAAMSRSTGLYPAVPHPYR